MKKTVIFSGIIAIGMILYLCSASYLTHCLTLEFQNEQGNRNELAPVSFHGSYKVGKNMTVFSIDNGKINTGHQIEHQKFSNHYEYTRMDMEKDLYVFVHYHSEKGKKYQGEACDPTEQCLSEAPVSYAWYKGENLNEFSTNVIDHHNENYMIKYSGDTWTREEQNTNAYDVEMSYDLNQTRENILYRVKEDTYIFVPITNEAMVGDNYIYGITYHKGIKKVEQLTKLPTDRIYDTNRFMDDILYIASHDKENIYLGMYQPDGTLIKEFAVKGKLTVFDQNTYIQKKDNILYMSTGDKLVLIDADDLDVLYDIDFDVNKVHDILFCDGKLYVNGILSNERGWRLAVYEGDTCLYQTDIVIPYDLTIAYMNGLMDFGTFEKVEEK